MMSEGHSERRDSRVLPVGSGTGHVRFAIQPAITERTAQLRRKSVVVRPVKVRDVVFPGNGRKFVVGEAQGEVGGVVGGNTPAPVAAQAYLLDGGARREITRGSRDRRLL